MSRPATPSASTTTPPATASPAASPAARPALHQQVAAHLAAAAVATLPAALAAGRALDLPDAVLARGMAATAAVFALVAASALHGLGGHPAAAGWGNANRVTLFRGCLIALAGGALPAAGLLGPGVLWLLTGLALAALALDGVDGWIARRQAVASAYGARFDMDLDTLLTLVLAALLWRLGEAGVWVLLTGLLRPLFVAAGVFRGWLNAPLPYSLRRRVVCVVQIAVLAAALTPLLDPPLSRLAVGAALGVLLFSFAADTVWLFRHAGRTRT
ncbi:CDP-alcohol phosphatidyltransferase family protein [Rhodospirillum centenum]|uniref:Integral membrane protein, putative n=1 Tax=Rhodospirillum centenum (strain ATCC 51521 / SW) TaxID=414684 RepID=B6IVH6_RHOCS|nr:CDP-alcohol phosphatidyltransferase family protein [Rhodospirillum centenum]ACJ00300.1 integral membrane protein, putative [Rhodospirillum centenum SW]